ncbi:MAG TPA: hypothetical protein VGF23_26455 [Gaiellaceae bacterium]
MADLSRFQRWYGRDEPPVERREVRAGPLTAELEGPDLRYVGYGGVEVVRRLYAAIRDRNWGTVPPALSDVELDVRDDSFSLRFEARNLDSTLGVDFRWRGELVGRADGTLTASLDGAPAAAFEYNRIGWCILHPAQNAGRRFRARTPDGLVEGALPDTIGPQLIVDGLPAPIFPSFSELEVEAADGVWARFELEGDLFETEDQRNWTDASFKTYSTPLSGGFPRSATAGERVAQTVRLSVSGPQSAPPATDGAVEIAVGEPLGRTVPAVGLGAASHDAPLTAREVELLRALGPAHLRVDVHPGEDGWRERLERDLADAAALGTVVELAVFAEAPLDELTAVLESHRPELARVLAFSPDEPTSSRETVAAVRERLGAAPVFGGTNILFTTLNCDRPELDGLDGVAWPLNATVHADDDTSVVETAATHGDTVRSARAFCDGLPLAVTPVTFNQRFNPVAAGPEPEPAPGQLPSQVDRRQPSLLGAAWTLATAKHLAEAGADSVTYFETTGWRGVMETPVGSPPPFASSPGSVFPLYHVLADLAGSRGEQLRAAESSEPLAVEAIALDGRVLLASLQPRPVRCRISGVDAHASIRRLDEDSFDLATTDPGVFRSRTESAGLELELPPYSYVRLDLE